MQRSRGRKIQNGLDFKGIQTDALSGDDEPKKSARFYAEDTLMWTEPNTVVSTTEKDFAKVSGMVLSFS